MKRYILSPRRPLIDNTLSMSLRRMTVEHRKSQIEEIRHIRSQNAVDREVVRWLSDGDPRLVKPVDDPRPARLTGTRVVDLEEGEAERLEAELQDVTLVEDCDLDLIAPNKATAGHKSRLDEADLWHLDAIGLTELRSSGRIGDGSGVTVAVLDTGISPRHPDLAPRIAEHVGIAHDGTVQPRTRGSDKHGHGTHVAGLVCGSITGIARDAGVIDCAMLPGGRGRLSHFAAAMEWCAGRPDIEIMNMSAGLFGYREGLETQVLDLLATGVLPVIAIGNEGRNQTRSPGNYLQVLSVGASNKDRHVSAFSGSGQMVFESHAYSVPSLVAPGESVYSCVKDGGYENWDGTSMATPIVAGVAALLLERYPDLTLSELGERLLASCIPLHGGRERWGSGLIQAVT